MMAALVLCSPCGVGDCDSHIRGQTIPGVLGGWLCPCKHTPEERERQREQAEAVVQRMFSPERDLGPPWPLRRDVERISSTHDLESP